MEAVAVDDMIAMGRVVAREQALCAEVLTENIRQLKKWGIQEHPLGYWLGILMEEVGEVAEALLATEPLTPYMADLVDRIYQLGLRAKAVIEGEQPDGISRVNPVTHPLDLGKELIQVAAVATAMEECRRRTAGRVV